MKQMTLYSQLYSDGRRSEKEQHLSQLAGTIGGKRVDPASDSEFLFIFRSFPEFLKRVEWSDCEGHLKLPLLVPDRSLKGCTMIQGTATPRTLKTNRGILSQLPIKMNSLLF